MKKLLIVLIGIILLTSSCVEEQRLIECQALYDEYNELSFKSRYGNDIDKEIFKLFIQENKPSLENCSKY